MMLGLALSATSYVVVLGAVAQVVSPKRRATAFGVVTAAGSFGTFTVVPIVQWLITHFGWQLALLYLAAAIGVIVFFALGLPSTAGPPSGQMSDEDTLSRTLGRARSHSGYLLLNAGFFVCGFHVSFIATHLPAFLKDHGLSDVVSATALSLIGLFNIGGSSLFGYLGDRCRKKYLLSLLYGSRAVVITLFLFVQLTATTAFVFACAIGFLWLATVPLTSGTVAQIFGSGHLSSLFEIVFFSHQIGSFLGVWLGGRFYDTTGSYDTVWLIAVALGVFAAAIHLPIADQPVTTDPDRVASTA